MTPEDREILKRIANGLENTGPKILGLPIRDFVMLAGVLLGLGGFYMRTNDAMEQLIKSNTYFSGYIQNADNFHSAMLNTQFYQGKPVNPNFESDTFRKFNLKPQGSSN